MREKSTSTTKPQPAFSSLPAHWNFEYTLVCVCLACLRSSGGSEPTVGLVAPSTAVHLLLTTLPGWALAYFISRDGGKKLFTLKCVGSVTWSSRLNDFVDPSVVTASMHCCLLVKGSILEGSFEKWLVISAEVSLYMILFVVVVNLIFKNLPEGVCALQREAER